MAHFFAQDRRHRVRVALAADQQRHERAWIRPERQIGDGVRLGLLEIALPHVGRDADHGRGERRRYAVARRRAALQVHVEDNPPADRIFIGKMQLRELLVDDRALAAGHAVFVSEAAAADERQADRVEIPRIDRQHRDFGRLLALLERLAVERQAPHEAALQGHVAGDGHGLDARVRLEPLLNLLIERQALFECRVLPFGQRQPHHQQLRRVHAQVHAVHRQEVAHHEAGACQQNNGQREFGNH